MSAAGRTNAASASASSAAAYLDEGPVEEATTWMQPMQRSWEEITEDEQTGALKSTQLQQQRERKKQLLATTSAGAGAVIEKGVIRYLYVIIDFSWCMNTSDMKPTRRAVTLDLLEEFIQEYFDQNPISQLGFIVAHDKLAYHVTELSGNPASQVAALRALADSGGGEFSLQNALDMARGKLAAIPPYGAREILVLMAALATVDPGDIHDSITACQQAHITCSVIALAAEMYVCTLLATTTGGNCNVALSRDHYKSLLFSHIPPLPAHRASARQRQARKWIHMGFPEQKYEPYPSLCACHEELRYGGYNCPKCLSKFCELPTECRVCTLTLVSAPHLARSYHHLFPVPSFTEVDLPTNGEAVPDNSSAAAPANTEPEDEVPHCRSCCLPLLASESLRLRCPSCTCIFCIDCDEYIHTTLHNCPGCLATTQTTEADAKPEIKTDTKTEQKAQ